MRIPTLVRNTGETGHRIVVRGEVNGETVFRNYLDDGDCVVEEMEPGVRLVVELEESHK